MTNHGIKAEVEWKEGKEKQLLIGQLFVTPAERWTIWGKPLYFVPVSPGRAIMEGGSPLAVTITEDWKQRWQRRVL